jgi:Zn-dependent alcohol dehydrogenase
MGSNRFRADVPAYAALHQQGHLRLDDMISARVDLADLPTALDDLRAGRAARGTVVFD